MMKHLRCSLLAGSLSAALVVGGAALAQTAHDANMSASTTEPINNSQPVQAQQGNNDQSAPSNANDTRAPQSSSSDRDPLSAHGTSNTTKRDVQEFDSFLDQHPQVAQDLRTDPSKVDDTNYLNEHKDLQRWLEKHPQVRHEITENPSAFMHQENRQEKRENKPQQ
jgi:hypothetical protein